ncbi:spherulation-specific family 4 protein [Aspergillus nidulans FGSC A4]|uniref:Cell surface spherulin 4-like protein, putative (AFU_orthologue AFUA_3G07900) n=1 Tax=Emericella nidulans (strain FGSC A4 / ATCC 38163 / CBS 112.46 / NRRL 194 / M139) TaxID=227321 RepID=C8VJ26_EMENI|nr:hypothetical protein [Aspergillus nidulans FGSC A4]CBF83684.1 TPA: cell surface spherulin 4-like protein, putative (AFU_orthologue; AFUA_3G07900) [Aspergillus nidulans FGSC A4]
MAVLIFVAILAIVLPTSIIVTRRKNNNMGPKAKVFVPLYVYPAPGAWDPLVNVITAHPDVNFTVVEIPRLTAHDNVRVLGYVATTYAKRNISSVRNDIETYAAWPTISANPKLAVRGIFFDETPQQYNASDLAYLEELTSVVKNTPGLGPDHFVFHNPGVVPDPRYLSTADSTVVFEATYDTFQDRDGARLFETIPNSNRSQLCAVVHSVPDSVEGSELRKFVKQARRVADEIFVTHLSTNYYASFGDKWDDFVRLMAQ